MKRINQFVCLLTVLILVSACGKYSSQIKRIPIARAGENVLYYDQLPDDITPGMSAVDSTSIVQNFISRWAKREIMKLKAIENLTPEFKTDVERQVEEMRTNLLIHQYQQQMINQKMDTVVTIEEIENYYASRESSFVLNSNIVKVLFIKVSSDIPNISRVSEWYRSSNPSDIAQLEVFCYQFADKFDDFNEQWIPLSVLLAELPVLIDNQDEFLRRNSYYETEEAGFHYFISFREYRLRGTLAPYEYVTDNIRSMILNNRRMEFLQSLENGLFSEAIRENIYKIYQ
jgi:nicotinamide riboside kinase